MDNKVKITDIIGYYEMAGHWFSCLKNKHIKNNNKNTVEPLSFDKTGKMCNIAQLFKNWLHLCRLGTRITRKIIIKKPLNSFCTCKKLHMQTNLHVHLCVCVRSHTSQGNDCFFNIFPLEFQWYCEINLCQDGPYTMICNLI